MSKTKKTEAPTDPSGELDREHLARIKSAQRRVEDCETTLADTRQQLKEDKAALTAALKELREEIADGTGRLPFDKPSDDQAGGNGEAWRSVSLDELKLSAAAVKKLVAADIHTLGALANYTAEGPLTDINGIGQALAEKVEKALEKWWEKNPLAKAAK